MNSRTAPPASSRNPRWNSSAVIPATSASASSFSPPCSTATFISWRTRLIAVPPASARMPTEVSAVESARISSSVRPAEVAAPASLVDISTISFSVVAKLEPRTVTAFASFGISL